MAALPEFRWRHRIFVFSYAGIWTRGSDPVGYTSGGQSGQRFVDSKVGAGPGIAFANGLAERIPGIEIGLVPAAKGGTSMDDWQPDCSRGSLYGWLIARAKKASPWGECAGLIWYQGENDSVDRRLVAGWQRKFEALIDAVRRDLAAPRMPVIMTILGPNRASKRYPFWTEFVCMQQTMRLPEGVVTVSANDLGGIEDDPHLTTADYVRLGERYADVFAALSSGRN